MTPATGAAAVLHDACWPDDRLGDALLALAQGCGIATAEAAPLPPRADGQPSAGWLHLAAARLGLEVEAVSTTVPGAGDALRSGAPALLPWRDAAGRDAWLLLCGGGRDRIQLLAPDGRRRRCPAGALRDAWCGPLEAPVRAEIDALIDDAAVPARRRPAVRAALLRERLAGTRLAPWWQLRLPPSAPLRRQAAAERLLPRLGAIAGVFALLYGGEALGWGLVGDGVLNGRLDAGWLAAWMLLLFTLLPLRLLGSALHAGFARRAATLLKSRLLVGALQMDVDRVRSEGVGRLLGRVIESSALEGLAIGGGLAMLVALLELAVAAAVLALGAAPGPHLLLLAGWSGLVLLLASRYGRRLADWTRSRLALTHDLIEQMVGHRTRLAQERPARRDARDDAALGHTLQQAKAMDGAWLPLHAALPGGWMAAALALLVPAFLGDGSAAVPLAISVGGILLAQRAFAGIAGGLANLARAAVAWREAGELLQAGRRDPARIPAALPVPRRTAEDGGAPLLDADRLCYAHPGSTPVLQQVDLRVAHGDRVLLQGPSGGGKSTLAALLTGLRRPQAGLLLLQGLDGPTLGDHWHALATAAPQFHENHVFSGSVAFNLLMGREWPPSPAVLREAEALCEELGLGDLLRRMPAGLQQRIGETGWQLSHGERSRLFLARALLQRAPLTVLDESFAALDPETLGRCLHCVQRHAAALVVIAHP